MSIRSGPILPDAKTIYYRFQCRYSALWDPETIRFSTIRFYMMTVNPDLQTFNPVDWITRSEAARLRKVSRQAIWDLVNRKRVTTMVVHGRIYLSRAELLNFKRRPRGPASMYYTEEEIREKKKNKHKRKRLDPAKWISKKDAAGLLGVPLSVISSLIRRRRLRTYVNGDETLVLRSAVENFKARSSRG